VALFGVVAAIFLIGPLPALVQGPANDSDAPPDGFPAADETTDRLPLLERSDNAAVSYGRHARQSNSTAGFR
jgi:hypothetical protein